MPEEQESRNVFQVVTYAATITPDPTAYDAFQVTLTGNVTIANPVSNLAGQELIMEFIQDATGTRTHTFGTKYKLNWTPDTTALLRNIITFYCDGTNWIQTGSAVAVIA